MNLRYKVGLLAVAFLLAVPAILADFPDDFDTYPTNATQAGPWTFVPDVAACWTGSEIHTDATNAQTPPNTFQFLYTAGGSCGAGAHSAAWKMNLNVTGTPVTFSLYIKQGTNATFSGTNTFQVSVCGSLTTFNYGTGQLQGHFIKHTMNGPGVMGSICQVRISANVSSFTTGFFNTLIDTTYTKNANAIIHSANFIMFNAQTGDWFNISGYKNSYLYVQFPAAPTVYYYNLTTPDLNVTTTGASLVTLWVGSFYFITIIPSQNPTAIAPNKVYLNPPDSPVLTYTINVLDLTAKFGPGTHIFIDNGVRVMVSGYLDAQNNLALWLVPGHYNVTLINGLNQYNTVLNFPSLNGAQVNLQILKVTVTNSCGEQCTISYGAGFSPALDHIIVFYNDTTLTTNLITDTLYKRNASGTFTLYTHTWSPGPWGEFTDSIACNTNICNSTLASQLYVNLRFKNTMGSSDSVNLAVTGGQFFAQTPNIPNTLLGWDLVFGAISFLNVIGFVAILSVGAIFGAFSAKFGVLVDAILAAALTYAGWLPLTGGAVTFLVAMAATAFISYLEKGR